jgi:hypothetical protein
MKLFLLVSSSILLVLGVVGSGAVAAAKETCGAGTISAGSHGSITVTGNCDFPDSGVVTINGNLTVADGAILNDHAFFHPATVHITGNVSVGKGAVLGLGYNRPEGVLGPNTVGGNVVANQPLTLYLGNTTVNGNVVSNGGGGDDAATRNFPIKDNVIGGNLILQGWSGGWIGAIRNHVGGNVKFSNNTALDTSTLPGIDSSEVVTNTIRGNLICQDNTPVAQIGDSGGVPNTVSGNKIGECAGL